MSKDELNNIDQDISEVKPTEADQTNSKEVIDPVATVSQTTTFKPTQFWKPIEAPTKLPCEILTPNDSIDPSYTNLTLPYRVICHQRYQKCAREYRKQFIKEIKRQEAMQFRALDGIRIRREFCDPLIEPLPANDRIKLTAKQKFRLDELMRN
ncbi:hypothetical protein WA026_008168 [Henosepilachna vigintioctopunctata]|uniref:Uncharacterized protein n=1 Tax=Henosepilachna vigintioctopunctata TaxID=420089 RepID=A0AAW1TR49_9CUCU